MYSVSRAKQFQKSYHTLIRSGKIAREEIESVVALLVEGDMMPISYRDHALKGDWAGFRECHIRGDVLLVYKKEKDVCVLLLIDIGSHNYLFS